MDSQVFNEQLFIGNTPLKSTYFFIGKSQFLLEESVSQLISTAKNNNFNQKEVFYINNKTKFQAIENSLSSPGLFNPIIIIDLRLETDKPTKKIGEKLAKIAQHNTKNLVIIQAPNLNYTTQKEGWHQTIQKHAQTVIAQPVNNNQLANWIFNKSQQLGIKLNSEAIGKIKDSSEGNLLWANQVLLQLVNRNNAQPIDIETVDQLLSDMSVFQLDDLMTTIFNKDPKSIKIAEKLEHENYPLTKVTFILSKDLSILDQLIHSHLPFTQMCKQLGIWRSKQSYFQAAIGLYSTHDIGDALSQIALLDRINKGQAKGNAWLLLHKIISELIFDKCPA